MANELVEQLVELLSHGNAATIQAVAEATCASCVAPDEVHELAQLGNKDLRSSTRKNVERDLHRWAKQLTYASLLPEPYAFEVLGARRGHLGVQRLQVKVLLPHEVLGSIFRFNEALFNKLFLPSTEALEGFWNREADGEWRRMHPRAGTEVPFCRCIPLGLWGDDATFNKRDKLLALLWNSVLKEPSTRIPCGALHYKRIVPTITVNALYKVLAWSFTAAASGRYPARDHAGKEFEPGSERATLAGKQLVDGYLFVYSETRGDLPYQIATFGWPGFAHSVRCCHLCHASKTIPNLWYTDVRREAPHKQTQISHREYMDVLTTADSRSPLCKIPGWHLRRVWQDAMHTLDSGIYSQANGACLWYLTGMQLVWRQSTRSHRLLFAHRQYVMWCHLNGIADVADPFKVEAFKFQSGSYPALQSLKAAEQRWLTVWLHAVLTALQQPDDLMRLMMLYYTCAVRFETFCRGESRIMPAEVVTAVREAGQGMLDAYNALALLCVERGLPLFKVLPKHHMFTHMLDAAEVANPRSVHNYADESTIGKLKRVAATCHPDSISFRVIDRYRLLLLVRLRAQCA